MGIPGLWQLVQPSVNMGDSFTTLTIREGFNARPHDREYRIGIDASIWIEEMQHGRLQTLFRRLVRLFATCARPIFVFDGPQRPKWKRGKRVFTQDHWLLDEFKELVVVFGFVVHTAPAEAEAELARMNQLGVIDAVLTEDSDAFVFGAKTIIRNSSYKNNHKDRIHTYSATAIEANASVALTRGGLLLIALLTGGDYDKGIPGCGVTIARALAQYSFGDTLLVAATSLDSPKFSTFAAQWREDIQHVLRNDPRNLLGRRYGALAATINSDSTFPKLDIIMKYLRPIVSNSVALHRLNYTRSHLDLERLSELVEIHFRWSEDQIQATFRKSLWAGIIYRDMVCTTVMRDDCGTSADTITPYTGMLSYDIKSFASDATECKFTVQDGSFTHTVHSSILGMRGIEAGRYQDAIADDNATTIAAPTVLVKHAWPAAVAAFQTKPRRPTKIQPQPQREIIDLTADDSDN